MLRHAARPRRGKPNPNPCTPDIREPNQFKRALARKSRYYYMSFNSMPVQGLKDWSGDEWAIRFDRHPQASLNFCTRTYPAHAHAHVHIPYRARAHAHTHAA